MVPKGFCGEDEIITYTISHFHIISKSICSTALYKAIARDYDNFFNKMLAVARINDRHFRDIRSALLKLLGESSPSTNDTPKRSSLFSNLPSGITHKLRELRRRLTLRICTDLTGSFTLHRGWTLFLILLYFVFALLLITHRMILI